MTPLERAVSRIAGVLAEAHDKQYGIDAVEITDPIYAREVRVTFTGGFGRKTEIWWERSPFQWMKKA